MDIAVVDPDIRPALKIAHRGSEPPSLPVRWLMRLTTAMMPAAKVPRVTVEQARTAGVRARVHRPPEPGRTALLWIHGGGYVFGNAKIDDRHCGDTARELGITVVAAEYRLAPEHPFPAPLDDVHAVWEWMQDQADNLGIDKERIAIGGQSAGGGLAAALVQRIHDEGGTQPAAQWLFCPMLDDRTSPGTGTDAVDHWVWNHAKNHHGWKSYLGRHPGALDQPEYSSPARRTDLSGLPPVWLDAGSIELFRDEILEYAERLRAAGVPMVYDEVPAAPHGFETWAIDSPPAQAVNARARRWLAQRLGISNQ